MKKDAVRLSTSTSSLHNAHAGGENPLHDKTRAHLDMSQALPPNLINISLVDLNRAFNQGFDFTSSESLQRLWKCTFSLVI